MKSRIFLVLIAVLVAGPVLAQKIYIEYDKDYDGSRNKTFAWSETQDTSLAQSDPALHSLIVNTIAGYITDGGIKQVDGDSDLKVTYHGSTKEDVVVNTSSYGYGYPSRVGYGRYGGYGGYHGSHYGVSVGVGVGSATVSSFKTGTLVIDIWDSKTDKLVWRGIAANITVSDNPHKLDKNIKKALKKMISKWEKIKRQNQ